MSKNASFDWPALMRAGLHGLGLQPEAFWKLTPAELQLMLGHKMGPAPLDRAGFAALLDAYPDQNGRTEDDRRD